MEIDLDRKEECKVKALEYKTRMEFKNNSMNLYCYAVKHKFLDEICGHMIVKFKNWNDDEILNEVLKYKNLSEIKEADLTLYSAIYRKKLNTKVLELIGRIGNRFHKCIYVYEFPDNSAYVGLTYNLEERQKNRDRSELDSVTKHINETGLTPVRKQLTNYIDVDLASKLEDEYINEYRNNGWSILNQVKGGSIGGSVIKWTKEACILEGQKYETRKDFRENSSSAYVTSKKSKWLDEVCLHMQLLKTKDGTFNYENCKGIALKYTNLSLFIKENETCYYVSKRKGWIKEIISHMVDDMRKPNGFYNKEYCYEIAKKYTDKATFRLENPEVYNAARKHNFLNEIDSHMTSLKKTKDSYTLEYCKSVALKYEILRKFTKENPYVYNICRENDWMNEITSHMKEYVVERYWTLERVKEEAIKYSKVDDFREYSSKAYYAARRFDYFDEVCSDMEQSKVFPKTK